MGRTADGKRKGDGRSSSSSTPLPGTDGEEERIEDGSGSEVTMSVEIDREVEALYAELPDVHCLGCGQCCVSPTCTLAEFLYLMRNVKLALPYAELERVLQVPAEVHPDYEGNIRCSFLRDSRCVIHQWRTGACRLFGVPALREMGIADLVECKNAVTTEARNSDAGFLRTWVDRLMALNQQLHPFGTSPFFLTALNLECWLDIYFDKTFALDYFRALRGVMLDLLDLSAHAPTYRPRTGIRDKLDSIAAFSDLMEFGDASSLRPLLLSIRDDFPLTGTYFHAEARMYLGRIDHAAAAQGQPS